MQILTLALGTAFGQSPEPQTLNQVAHTLSERFGAPVPVIEPLDVLIPLNQQATDAVEALRKGEITAETFSATMRRVQAEMAAARSTDPAR